jgi:hypothetical protein
VVGAILASPALYRRLDSPGMVKAPVVFLAGALRSYRSHVPVGRVRFNVHNFGEDGHDLAVRNRRGKLLGVRPELEPAENGRLSVRLRRPGRYTVFCSLEGHEALGMRAILRVR